MADRSDKKWKEARRFSDCETRTSEENSPQEIAISHDGRRDIGLGLGLVCHENGVSGEATP
jgi:hypothetical protein